MNNLKTTQVGGLPLFLEDARFLHNSYLEALKGAMSPFGVTTTDAIILSGMVRSIVGSDVEYTEGYFSYNGEIYHFPAQTYPVPSGGENEYLTINVTYDPSGLKVFESAAAFDTYEVRKGLMVKSVTLPSGGIILADVKRFYDVIRTNIDTERAGVVKDFAGDSIPDGYLLCDGAAVSRTTYAALFAAIGTLWGVGDGSTTFNLPNMKGRFNVGFDGSEADYNTVGKIGGEKEHTLTIGELAEHSHNIRNVPMNVSSIMGGANLLRPISAIDPLEPTDVSGGNEPHENRPPYAVFKKIIRI